MLWALLIILCAAVILKKLWTNLETLEGFTGSPNRSTNKQVNEGASTLFNWGLPDDDDEGNGNSKPVNPSWNQWKPQPPVNSQKAPVAQGAAPTQNDGDGGGSSEETCIKEPEFNCKDMGKCPIILHPDITKYVLKSSVPPCPDMRDYVLKSELPPDVDMDDYILKSEVPACPKCPEKACPDAPECPKCPQCPVCPRCPSGGDGKVDLEKYMLRSECRRLLREQASAGRGKVDKKVARAAERGDDDTDGGFLSTVVQDIQNVFGYGASLGSGGGYKADGSYSGLGKVAKAPVAGGVADTSGLTTQGLAVGDVYKAT